MKQHTKSALRLTLTAGLLTAAFASNVLADDEDRTKIRDITLDFSYDTSDNEVSVDASGEGFELDDFKVVSYGNTPKIRVYLQADDDHYFSSKSSSIFDLSGEGARLSGSPSIKNDKSEMVVTVVLRDVEGWNDVDEAYWQENSAIAHWTDTGSSKYQIRLYRNGTAESSIITVHNNVYNFNGDIKQSGSYTFKVRVESDDRWNESDSLYVSSEDVSYYQQLSPAQPSTSDGPGGVAPAGEWISVGPTWWYRNADGSYTTNNWQYINDHWYFFDGEGWMKTGWIFWNDKWYYCDSSGAMLANTWTPDNYYVGADGAWVQ